MVTNVKIINISWCILLLLSLFCVFGNAQTERWVYQYNGTLSGPDFGQSFVYGLDGYLYLVGSSKNASWDDDFTVISLDQEGTQRWVYLEHTPGSTSDVARSIAYGIDGSVYIAGSAHRSGVFDDLIVICLNSDGNEQWNYRSNNSEVSWEYVYEVIYGLDGNLYIVGASNQPGNWGYFSILSLDSDGNERWLYRLPGSIDQPHWAKSVVYGLDGNIYAAGYIDNLQTRNDLVVVSIDQNGMERWVYQYNNVADKRDRAHSLVYGNNGFIYVVGESENTENNSDIIVICLTIDGLEQWLYRYTGTANAHDEASSVVLGSDGNVYLTGCSYGVISSADVIVISLDQDGLERWVYRYGPPRFDRGDDIEYGIDGNIYVFGRSADLLGYYDLLVVKLGNDGSEDWVYQYGGTLNRDDWAQNGVFGNDGNLYVCGTATDSLSGRNIVAISVDPITGLVENKTTEIESSSCATIINGPIKLPNGKSFKVFDITGRVVLPDRIQPGIYFIEIDGEIVNKVIKIK